MGNNQSHINKLNFESVQNIVNKNNKYKNIRLIQLFL